MSTYHLIEAIVVVTLSAVLVPFGIYLLMKNQRSKKYSKRAVVIIVVSLALLTVNCILEGAKLI